MSEKGKVKINEMTFNDVMQKSVVTEEFFEAYSRISEKYWTLPKGADDYQRNAHLLHVLSHSSDEKLVIAAGIVILNIFQILEKGQGTVSGCFGVGNKDIYFRLSDSPDGMDKMQKLMNNTVMVKANEDEGN